MGRRVYNVGPTDSVLVQGRSARPGDPVFDQNFGTQTGTFSRANTRDVRFEDGGPQRQNSNLRDSYE